MEYLGEGKDVVRKGIMQSVADHQQTLTEQGEYDVLHRARNKNVRVPDVYTYAYDYTYVNA